MKTTAWYSGDQKPVRVGVYERRYPFGDYFSFWDGQRWCSGQSTKKRAWLLRRCETPTQNLPWRGLEGPTK